MDTVTRRLERGTLTLDDVRAWGRGEQRTPTGLEVRHACPECPLGRPAPGCGVCAGRGTLDERQLHGYQRLANGGVLL